MKPITIVGGGLAGLTLGIGLRQRGIPVTVWEAGHYPRVRVCGEFISGRGQATLGRLGLLKCFTDAGAVLARTAAFASPCASSPVRPLPQPALCLARSEMDSLLAENFRQGGGGLRENQRWPESEFAEGVVRATGRRLQPRVNGWRWFGLKVHARQAALVADLEVHALPHGYVGLCRLRDGEVNVCGLFRRPQAAREAALPWDDMLRGSPGTPLGARLANAVFDDGSFCSVAGLCLRPQRAAASSECRLGDTLTMIPPVTGNGMSMAFESAEMAMAPLAAYSEGKISWASAKQAIAHACDRAFAQRLFWANWLQGMMFAPILQGSVGSFALRSELLWRLMFAKTR
jgi:2-polyprenyl-6-methoxyphenol hydroxylase-like FAD-dependent oxidoreductase